MMLSEATKFVDTKADIQIKACLDKTQSFSVIAGAGSGKTTSLILALKHLRTQRGKELRRDDKRIACITYTKRAVQVIFDRLDRDDLFLVSTLHSFLWQQVKRFTPNITQALKTFIIPGHIEKKQKDDNGGQSKKAVAAREKIASLQSDLEHLDDVPGYKYDETNFSDYPKGLLNHDDVIGIAAYLINENKNLRKILGQRYPFVFVDEAQDTFTNVVEAINTLCSNDGIPVVGYFGDPMQQIYDKRAGEFTGPENSLKITKEENFRCSQQVIDLLNAFRTDVRQIPAGENKKINGSVLITLVKAETPGAPRNRYTEEQIERASLRFEEALQGWGWQGRDDVKKLFLVRQMIARRLGFPMLQQLFTGRYASSRAQEDYEAGEHFLLKPFVDLIYHLVQAHRQKDLRKIIDILRRFSPAFDPKGKNAAKTLKEMKELAAGLIHSLSEKWGSESLEDILRFCQNNGICKLSERLCDHLDREPRAEEYIEAEHSGEKGDWLADCFFGSTATEIGPYVEFILENTPYSTQHGVKGEEYKNVVVVFDDAEAAWTHYSFAKMLTPRTSGVPTAGQNDKSRKLAYVCFSRAEENLRILLFTPDPHAAKTELVSKKLFKDDQTLIME